MRATDSVTPFVLTFNEEENIQRTLDSLRWAKCVLVLDSGSTDATVRIARSFPNVVLTTRPFDNFRGQSEHALQFEAMQTEYALALDADMVVTRELADEIAHPFLDGSFAGGILPFEYWMLGRPLAGSLLKPQLRLFRRNAVRVVQEGHGHKFHVDGPTYQFRAKLLHDDRKPLERWVGSQLGYSRQELAKLREMDERSLRAWLRRSGLMPFVAGGYAYLRAGGPLKGGASLRYAWERVLFEVLLSMRLLDSRADENDQARSGATTGKKW